jgi:transposase
MRFYTQQHKYYCGVDLHARSIYVCILNQEGAVLVHKNLRAKPDAFLAVIAPFREDLVVAVECMFTWYWIADLCAREGLTFVLGHALYMKAIHGGKAKNDRIDSHKIAHLLRGGNVPFSYVYPQAMRATRDLLRRRNFLMRKRAELFAHIQNTNSQYNLPEFDGALRYPANREDLSERFTDDSVKKSIETDLGLIDVYDKHLKEVELYLTRHARVDNPNSYHILKTVPGVGQILGLVLLYEIHDIARFPRVQDFVSYCRLIRCSKESAGKKLGTGGRKIGNAHLKWAFSEATCLFLRGNGAAQKYLARLESKHGKGKALGILSRKLGTAVYYMLKRQEAFDMNKFFEK